MSVAVPLVIRRLDSSVTAVSWMMNGYNLVLTVLFLPMGRLADRCGHKRVFVLGLAVFTVASLGCALSGTVEQLIAFRVRAGGRRRGRDPDVADDPARRLPGSAARLRRRPVRRRQLAAAALGPVLGGVLIERWGWPAVFWFNLPVGRSASRSRWRSSRDRRERPAPAASQAWTGPASPSSPPASSASPSRLIQGNPWGWTSARDPRAVRRRRAPARPVGVVGAARRASRSSTCASSGGARSPRRAPRS